MNGTSKLLRRVLQAGLACLLLLASAAPAGALEFFDGRLEIHGYYETQIRSIWTDFNEDDWDLTQWYHILDIEAEADFAPDGIGPIELLQGFVRAEVRFDCVWTRACGLFPSANVYGNRSERLPKRLDDGRYNGFKGDQFLNDTRFYYLKDNADLGIANRKVPVGSRRAFPFWGVEGFRTLFDQAGPDGVLGTAENPGDDPPFFVFSDLFADDCVYGARQTRGPANGVGVQMLPHNPGCRIRSIGSLRDKPNPFNPRDRNSVVLGGAGGGLALPYRPAPDYKANGQGPHAPRGEAQGIFLPNERLAAMLRDDEFGSFDQNFSQAELQWNHGASQQDEGELKEAYLDIEMFEARLWIRAGKQSIVWGKTELFRTTDQFNPQDLALSSLPSLEESRIALWAVRAVWSFWNVGPFNDVRLEVAANLDKFEPTDIGRCGEPYAPLPVCDKTFGLQVHGLTGIGIAGDVRPPGAWESWKGVEVGARLEWRWDRFSFALSDFYGYNDSFYVDRIFQYSRNVDPFTGRPREGMSTGSCRKGTEDACLRSSEALRHQSVNQQVFAMICASSVGVVPDLDPSACGQSIFNSRNTTDPTNPLAPNVIAAFNTVLAGQNTGGLTILHGASVLENLAGFTPATFRALNRFPGIARAALATASSNAFCLGNFGALCPTPLVALNADPADGGPAVPFALAPDGISPWAGAAIDPYLTDEQEALLGCGPFYGTDCDLQGIDLLNTEASVLFQSFPIFDGTFPQFWDTTDKSRPQPGTVNFKGGPIATRYVNGKLVMLPGSRGPGDPGYDPRVDGTVQGKRQPFTRQVFKNEMAILSWNFLMGAVGLSTGSLSDDTVFDPDRPFADDRCSFKRPQRCSFVQDLVDLTSIGRPSIRAAGNGRYGRRDFTWAAGADVALRYEKRNVLGFSMDFAEDVTKSNWSLESTWIEGLPFADNDELDYLTDADTFNLTISVDRPTFVNFINPNRTLFMNAQFFIQYVDGYNKGFTSNGPWNFLMTFAVNTGYFQDRLLPNVTFVYDFGSNSGAVLPEVQYRFTENFSATFGVAMFYGRWEERDLALHPITPSSTRQGSDRGSTFVENGLSPIRERDEIFLRIRYTY